MNEIEILPGHVIDFSSLPYGATQVILCCLRNPLCSAETVNILADSMATMRESLSAILPYFKACASVEVALRNLAPLFGDRAHAALN